MTWDRRHDTSNPDCKIKTPILQKMADEGILFMDAHSTSAVCTPTRYGLLTGRYNWRSVKAKVSSVVQAPSDTSRKANPCPYAAEGWLHHQMIGKWHLGWDWHKDGNKIDFTKPVKNGPDINGFDGYYGHCGSLDMPPYVWVDTGNTAVPKREEGVTLRKIPMAGTVRVYQS